MLSGIKKSLNKQYAFHCTSRHVGKGEREGVKRMHEVDKNNKIIKTCLDYKSIEDRIIKHNKMHITKAHNSVACAGRTHKKLRDNEVRNRTLDRRLNEDECNYERVHEFLQLLKVPNEGSVANNFQ